MALSSTLFATLAIIPAMTAAPVPQGGQSGGAILVALCNGGQIALAIGGDTMPLMAVSPCCAKGYHSSKKRRDREAEAD